MLRCSCIHLAYLLKERQQKHYLEEGRGVVATVSQTVAFSRTASSKWRKSHMLLLGCLTIFNNLKFQSNVNLFNKDSVSEAETKECAVSTNFTRSPFRACLLPEASCPYDGAWDQLRTLLEANIAILNPLLISFAQSRSSCVSTRVRSR